MIPWHKTCLHVFAMIP